MTDTRGKRSVASAHREAQLHKGMKGEWISMIFVYIHSVYLLRIEILSNPKVKPQPLLKLSLFQTA